MYDGDIITTEAKYYSSGSSYPPLAFGNCGYVSWEDYTPSYASSRLYIVITRNKASENINELDTENCIVKKISLTVDEMNLQNRLKADVAREIRTADVIDRSVARIPMYQSLDTIKIDTSNKTVREIANEIMLL